VMLRDGGQALVEQVLQRVVVHADNEWASPQIWSPVVHGVDEANQFSLVRHQLGVARRHGSTEECNWSGPLMKDDTNARP
jgi:hypothetical protein